MEFEFRSPVFDCCLNETMKVDGKTIKIDNFSFFSGLNETKRSEINGTKNVLLTVWFDFE